LAIGNKNIRGRLRRPRHPSPLRRGLPRKMAMVRNMICCVVFYSLCRTQKIGFPCSRERMSNHARPCISRRQRPDSWGHLSGTVVAHPSSWPVGYRGRIGGRSPRWHHVETLRKTAEATAMVSGAWVRTIHEHSPAQHQPGMLGVRPCRCRKPDQSGPVPVRRLWVRGSVTPGISVL
jgi:hypothetical protein